MRTAQVVRAATFMANASFASLDETDMVTCQPNRFRRVDVLLCPHFVSITTRDTCHSCQERE